MPRGLVLMIGGVVLGIGIVIAGLTLYHPPRPSYILVTPEPVALATAAPAATSAPTAVPTSAPTAAPTSAPTAVPTSAPTAAPAGAPTRASTPAGSRPAPPALVTGDLDAWWRGGLPALAVGALVLVTGGAGALTIRRRRRPPATTGDTRGPAPGDGTGGRWGRRARRTPRAGDAASPALELDLGGVEVAPLLDDDAAIRAAEAHPVERGGDLGWLAPEPPVAAPAPDGAGWEQSVLGRGAGGTPQAAAGAAADDDFTWADASPPVAPVAPVAPVVAAVAVDALAADDRAAEIPQLGPPLPPPAPAGALPPVAVLDRPAALRWVSSE